MFDDGESISFWPAYADFMLALLLIFLTAFGITILTAGVDPQPAMNCQARLERDFRDNPNLTSIAKQSVQFETENSDPFLLMVRFSDDRLLFVPDDAVIKPDGAEMLRQLASSMLKQLPAIREIQIHGHADIRASVIYTSNLLLAADRAISVFRFLQLQGIDPVSNAMSATSYGEYFPPSRQIGQPFTDQDLLRANGNVASMDKNRRVELLLRYGGDASGCQE